MRINNGNKKLEIISFKNSNQILPISLDSHVFLHESMNISSGHF